MFEVNVSIAAKGCFDMFCPLSLPLRVFLSPQGVDVMREQSDRLVRGVSQTTARHPRLQAARRRGTTCVTQNKTINHQNNLLPPPQHINESFVKQTIIMSMLTHIPGANKHRDHVRFTQLRVPGFHHLEELAEGVTFLKEIAVSQ